MTLLKGLLDTEDGSDRFIFILLIVPHMQSPAMDSLLKMFNT